MKVKAIFTPYRKEIIMSQQTDRTPNTEPDDQMAVKPILEELWRRYDGGVLVAYTGDCAIRIMIRPDTDSTHTVCLSEHIRHSTINMVLDANVSKNDGWGADHAAPTCDLDQLTTMELIEAIKPLYRDIVVGWRAQSRRGEYASISCAFGDPVTCAGLASVVANVIASDVELDLDSEGDGALSASLRSIKAGIDGLPKLLGSGQIDMALAVSGVIGTLIANETLQTQGDISEEELPRIM